MLRAFIQHLHFTKTERFGALGLAFIFCLVYMAPEIYHRYFLQARKTDFSAFQRFVAAHAADLGIEADSLQPAKQPPAVFPFDPNTASAEDFERLGLSEKTAQSILHYREKGGQFRKPEDFQKIYTLSIKDFERLEPYIRISAKQEKWKDQEYADAPRPAQYAGGGYEKKYAPRGPVDINRSSVEDWVKLPMIGEKRARQIINFRESLGGFLTVEQVREVFNLPDSVYQMILPHLVLETKTVHKLNLNTATIEDLNHHPYISGKQAMLIVRYREQHGAFASVEDLKNIIAFKDQAWLEQIKPYIGIE